MYAFSKLRFVALAIGSLLFGAAASQARPVYIMDNAGFFSPAAKAEASRNIADFEQKLHKEIVVETFQSLPADVQNGLNAADKAAVSKAVGQWAQKQARANQVNGVYILLVKSPAHLQIEVGNDTQKKAFTLQDRDALANLMLTDLRGKQNDEALRSGVNYVVTTMRAHESAGARTGVAQPYDLRRASEPAPERSSGGGILKFVVVLLVIWVVVGVVRSLFRGASGMSGGGYGGGGPMMGPMWGGYGGGGGGGGFFSSLVGGMFGAAAGNWLYDRFSGGHETSTLGSTPEVRQVDDPGYTGKDTDYSGTGGSFDDNNSGSGDSGSGDSGGGGDFGGGGDSGGGGDFGGGGDSGGGGGGDF